MRRHRPLSGIRAGGNPKRGQIIVHRVRRRKAGLIRRSGDTGNAEFVRQQGKIRGWAAAPALIFAPRRRSREKSASRSCRKNSNRPARRDWKFATRFFPENKRRNV